MQQIDNGFHFGDDEPLRSRKITKPKVHVDLSDPNKESHHSDDETFNVGHEVEKMLVRMRKSHPILPTSIPNFPSRRQRYLR